MEEVNELINKAKKAITKVEDNRMDGLRIMLRTDADDLLYSIANSLLALAEMKIKSDDILYSIANNLMEIAKMKAAEIE